MSDDHAEHPKAHMEGRYGRPSPEGKPLHVQVAEALGMEEIKLRGGMPGTTSHYYIDSRRQYLEGQAPRFDTDWSVTGPLIERLKIQCAPPVPASIALIPSHWQWVARAHQNDFEGWEFAGLGASALIAICNLILALKAAGKLEEKVTT